MSCAQAVIWFLARWVDTYLMPIDAAKGQLGISGHDEGLQQHPQSSKKVLLSFAGQHSQGETILDTIIRISMTTLTSYPGENELQVHPLTSNKVFFFYFFLLL